MKRYLDVLPEIQHALDHNQPVVALESTILSHGMPYPENVGFAAEVGYLQSLQNSPRTMQFGARFVF